MSQTQAADTILPKTHSLLARPELLRPRNPSASNGGSVAPSQILHIQQLQQESDEDEDFVDEEEDLSLDLLDGENWMCLTDSSHLLCDTQTSVATRPAAPYVSIQSVNAALDLPSSVSPPSLHPLAEKLAGSFLMIDVDGPFCTVKDIRIEPPSAAVSSGEENVDGATTDNTHYRFSICRPLKHAWQLPSTWDHISFTRKLCHLQEGDRLVLWEASNINATIAPTMPDLRCVWEHTYQATVETEDGEDMMVSQLEVDETQTQGDVAFGIHHNTQPQSQILLTQASAAETLLTQQTLASAPLFTQPECPKKSPTSDKQQNVGSDDDDEETVDPREGKSKAIEPIEQEPKATDDEDEKGQTQQSLKASIKDCIELASDKNGKEDHSVTVEQGEETVETQQSLRTHLKGCIEIASKIQKQQQVLETPKAKAIRPSETANLRSPDLLEDSPMEPSAKTGAVKPHHATPVDLSKTFEAGDRAAFKPSIENEPMERNVESCSSSQNKTQGIVKESESSNNATKPVKQDDNSDKDAHLLSEGNNASGDSDVENQNETQSTATASEKSFQRSTKELCNAGEESKSRTEDSASKRLKEAASESASAETKSRKGHVQNDTSGVGSVLPTKDRVCETRDESKPASGGGENTRNPWISEETLHLSPQTMKCDSLERDIEENDKGESIEGDIKQSSHDVTVDEQVQEISSQDDLQVEGPATGKMAGVDESLGNVQLTANAGVTNSAPETSGVEDKFTQKQNTDKKSGQNKSCDPQSIPGQVPVIHSRTRRSSQAPKADEIDTGDLKEGEKKTKNISRKKTPNQSIQKESEAAKDAAEDAPASIVQRKTRGSEKRRRVKPSEAENSKKGNPDVEEGPARTRRRTATSTPKTAKPVGKKSEPRSTRREAAAYSGGGQQSRAENDGIFLLVTGGDLLKKREKEGVKSLGMTILEKPQEWSKVTHLVVDEGAEAKRTPKAMLAMCRASYVVTTSWLRSCLDAGKVLPTTSIVDPEVRKHQDATKRVTIEGLTRSHELRQSGKRILSDFSVSILKNVAGSKNKAPELDELRCMIEGAGGVWLGEGVPSNVVDGTRAIVITSDPCKPIQKRELKSSGEDVIPKTTTWLFETLMSQQLNLD